MFKSKLKLYLLLLSCTVFVTLPFSTTAQPYPNKSIRLVITFPPGGIADTLARVVGQGMSKQLGQTVVIDNKPGAGGNIAASTVAKSTPDGYTLLLGLISTHAINASLYKELPYDPIKDFQPIGRIAQTPLILVVHPSLAAKNIAEFISLAKANPGKINYGSSGIGSASHLAMAAFAYQAGIDVVHVPYKGTGALQTDLLDGRIQAYFDAQVSGQANITAGKTKLLGVASSKRLQAFPQTATISETLSGYEFSTWYGLFAPAGLASERLNQLSLTLVNTLNDPETLAFFSKQGLEATPSSPKEFAEFIRNESQRLGKIVRDVGASSE